MPIPETLNCAFGTVPMPLRATTCSDGVELSETESEAEREPVPVGENVTAIEQALPALSVAAGPMGQLFVCAKSRGFAPVIAMLEMVSGPVPVFCKVTV